MLGAVLEKGLAGHGTCVTWAPVRLTNFHLGVHMSMHSVVSSSESKQDDLVSPAQRVIAAILVKVGVLLFHFCCTKAPSGHLGTYVGFL